MPQIVRSFFGVSTEKSDLFGKWNKQATHGVEETSRNRRASVLLSVTLHSRLLRGGDPELIAHCAKLGMSDPNTHEARASIVRVPTPDRSCSLGAFIASAVLTLGLKKSARTSSSNSLPSSEIRNPVRPLSSM